MEFTQGENFLQVHHDTKACPYKQRYNTCNIFPVNYDTGLLYTFILKTDQAKEWLLCLWAAWQNHKSFSRMWLNRIRAASADYWEDDAAAPTTRTVDSFEWQKPACKPFEGSSVTSQETGRRWCTLPKTPAGGGSELLRLTLPWHNLCQRSVNLKKI